MLNGNLHPLIQRKQLKPNEYLKLRLDPIGSELDAMLARGLVVGMLPDHGAIHVTYRCNSDADRCSLLRQLAERLLAEADRLEKPRLVVPSYVKSGG